MHDPEAQMMEDEGRTALQSALRSYADRGEREAQVVVLWAWWRTCDDPELTWNDLQRAAGMTAHALHDHLADLDDHVKASILQYIHG